jgi:hypothetical protein
MEARMTFTIASRGSCIVGKGLSTSRTVPFFSYMTAFIVLLLS